jgi:2'-5' RNA ligase
VTAVICAGFDPDLDAAVLRRIAALRDAGLRVSRPRHPPHLTLAAATVGASQLDDVRALVAGAAARTAPFAVRLDQLGTFSGGVLWLGPRPSARLAALQMQVDGLLRAAGHARAFGARSDPERWIPHCTLARRLAPQALDGAVATLTGLTGRFRPLIGRVERLLMIRLAHPAEAEVTPLRGEPLPDLAEPGPY